MTQDPTASSSVTDYDDLPQDIKDQIARMEAEDAAAKVGTAVEADHAMDEDVPIPTTSNIRICPHCTFENSHGGTDCEVCGLPLG